MQTSDMYVSDREEATEVQEPQVTEMSQAAPAATAASAATADVTQGVVELSLQKRPGRRSREPSSSRRSSGSRLDVLRRSSASGSMSPVYKRRNSSSSSGSSASFSISNEWTSNEDDALRAAVLSMGLGAVSWEQVSTLVGTLKAPESCQRRWDQLKDIQVKGAWSEAEDALVKGLVGSYGAKRWTALAAHVPGRTGKQCRERWLNHLAPDIKKSPWTQEEDAKLASMQNQMGNQWSRISAHLEGRTENACKNRWNSLISRSNGGIKHSHSLYTGASSSSSSSSSAGSKSYSSSASRASSRKAASRGSSGRSRQYSAGVSVVKKHQHHDESQQDEWVPDDEYQPPQQQKQQQRRPQVDDDDEDDWDDLYIPGEEEDSPSVPETTTDSLDELMTNVGSPAHGLLVNNQQFWQDDSWLRITQ